MKSYIVLIIILSSFGKTIAQKNPIRIKSNKIYTTNNQVLTTDGIPLNGYYRVKKNKHTYLYSQNCEIEISYFKEGFREGVSKEFESKKLLREGSYVDGLKHGTWKEYDFNGELNLTSEFKNGKKNGTEFGEFYGNGKFTCDYINDSIEGFLLKYNKYSGCLEYKEYYEKGRGIYKHKYNNSSDIIEEQYCIYIENHLKIKTKIKRIRTDIHIDSIFYNTDNDPFKILHYENDRMIFKNKILIEKDTIHEGEDDYVLKVKSYDETGNKTTAFIYINGILLEPQFVQILKIGIINSHEILSPCSFARLLYMSGFSEINIFYTYNSSLYLIESDDRDMLNGNCFSRKIDGLGYRPQTY